VRSKDRLLKMMGRSSALGRVLVFGANTDVGKTVVTSGVVRAACATLESVYYVKPLQTGSEHGHSDERTVRRTVGTDHLEKLRSATLYSWAPAVSAHVAAESGPAVTKNGIIEAIPSDEEVCESISKALEDHADAKLSLVETAGGVLSPGPSRTLQADMYAGLGLPVLLVGDGRLGGISSTLCAVESLQKRGFNLAALALIEDESGNYGNIEFLQRYLSDTTSLFAFSGLPPEPEPLQDWHEKSRPQFDALVKHLVR